MKIAYCITAWIFVLLAAIGAVLPVMPTTPFLLLALWGFSKCSPRFHDLLYNHKLFGPTIQRWHKYHVISVYAKTLSISMMSISLVSIIFFTEYHYSIKVITFVIIAYGAYFVLSKPSKPLET